jgi:hypothetical protein
VSLDDPSSYLTFYPAPMSGQPSLRSANVNVKWVEPPDIHNYSIQLNALSQKFWAQVVVYFDTGDHIDNHIDFWGAYKHPLGFWVGGAWLGGLTGQFDVKVLSQSDFEAGRRSITLGLTEQGASWAVFDETQPHDSPTFKLFDTEIFWGDNPDGTARILEAAVANLEVVGGGSVGVKQVGAMVKFSSGKLHAHWGFAVPVMAVNNDTVTVEGEAYQNHTGESSNMRSTLDSITINAAEQAVKSF